MKTQHIALEDLLNLLITEDTNIKVKFNQYNGENNPIDIFLKNSEVINSEWLFWREKRRYFNEGDIAISLVDLGNHQWLLTTIKKITKELDKESSINYEGVELERYKSFFGRVVVKFHKKTQTQVRIYSTIKEELIVNEILPTIYDGADFNGYDKVSLMFSELESIVNCRKKDWVNALENQKAVYLITDTNTGKLYVGSATSKYGMLLARWSNYISNGHGGNEDLKTLVSQEGKGYVEKYFKFSILENYNAKVDDSTILERESWWKKVFETRKFGYNKN